MYECPCIKNALFSLSVQQAPMDVIINGETIVLRGDSTMLNCTASGGLPPPAFKWSIMPGDGNIQAQYTILSNGSLFLMDIPASEDTTYCCEVFNNFATTGETCIALTVYCECVFSLSLGERKGGIVWVN